MGSIGFIALFMCRARRRRVAYLLEHGLLPGRVGAPTAPRELPAAGRIFRQIVLDELGLWFHTPLGCRPPPPLGLWFHTPRLWRGRGAASAGFMVSHPAPLARAWRRIRWVYGSTPRAFGAGRPPPLRWPGRPVAGPRAPRESAHICPGKPRAPRESGAG